MTEELANMLGFLIPGAVLLALGRIVVRSNHLLAPGYRELFGMEDADNLTLQRFSGWLLLAVGAFCILCAVGYLVLALFAVGS